MKPTHNIVMLVSITKMKVNARKKVRRAYVLHTSDTFTYARQLHLHSLVSMFSEPKKVSAIVKSLPTATTVNSLVHAGIYTVSVRINRC